MSSDVAVSDIPECAFHEFHFVKFHLDFFYLAQIPVELAQSDFLEVLHLKVASRRIFVRVRY